MRPSMACWRTSAAGSAPRFRPRLREGRLGKLGGRQFRGPPPRRISGNHCKGGGGGSQPAPQSVDPTALANAQLQSNVGSAETQAQLNNLNTFSPYGSTTYQAYQYDPNTGKPSGYNANQVLSPQLASLFGTQTGLAQGVAGGYGPYVGATNALLDLARTPLAYAGNMAATLPQGINLAGVPNVGILAPGSFATNVTGGAGGQAIPNAVTGVPLQTNLPLQTNVPLQTNLPQQTSVNTNFSQLTQQAQDAAYNQQKQYLDPQFSQAEESLRQNLADQGIEEGSPAFSRAMLDFNNQKQQAYGNAQDQAVQAGNAQQQALFGQSIAGGEFANQAQQNIANFANQTALAGAGFTNQALLSGAGLTNQALSAMGQFQNAALLSGAGLTNQAQQQLFGQGMSLADLYNQAVLGAAGQNLQAQQGNLGVAQAAFGAPWSAAQNFANLGTSLYGLGLGTLGQALPGVTAWPTGPTALPNLAPGTATGVSPANVVGAQQAATAAQQARYAAGQQNLSNTLGFANMGLSSLGLGGGSSGGLFNSGGLLGGLFSGGGGQDFSGGLTGTGQEVWDTSSGGGGGILGGIGSALGSIFGW